MTSIFYPLLISMLPPPPPLPPPLPPSPPPVRSSPSAPLHLPVNSLRSPSLPPLHHQPPFLSPAPSPPPPPLHPPPLLPGLSLSHRRSAPRPSVLRENVHVHRAHSRRNNHFFVPDNTRSASPASCKFSSSLDHRLRPTNHLPPPTLPTPSRSLVHPLPPPARASSPFFRQTFFRLSPFFYPPIAASSSSSSCSPSYPSAPLATYCRTGRNRTDVDAAVFHLSVPRGSDDIFFRSLNF